MYVKLVQYNNAYDELGEELMAQSSDGGYTLHYSDAWAWIREMMEGHLNQTIRLCILK